MTRGRFVYDKEQKKLIPIAEYRANDPEKRSKVTIIGDEMPETVHPCNGRGYTSKSHFRRITKENGCVEVGHDKGFFKDVYEPKPKDNYIDDGSLKAELIDRIRNYNA